MTFVLKSLKHELLEKDIETALCKAIRKLGGIPYKFTSPANRSVPDRLCVMPYGVVVFIECKRPKATTTQLQQATIDKLKLLGHRATTVSTLAEVNRVILWIRTLMEGAKK